MVLVLLIIPVFLISYHLGKNQPVTSKSEKASINLEPCYNYNSTIVDCDESKGNKNNWGQENVTIDIIEFFENNNSDYSIQGMLNFTTNVDENAVLYYGCK